jgi:hypothetical protein
MTDWSQFTQDKPAAPTQTIDWSQFRPLTEEEKKPKRTLAGTVKDVAVSLGKGAVDVSQIAVGAADEVTGGHVGKFLENKGGLVGYRPQEMHKILDNQFSDAQKYENAQYETDKKTNQGENPNVFQQGLGTVQALIQHPSVAVGSAIESLPSMGAGRAVATGLKTAMPKLSGIAAGALGEGAVMTGSQAENIRQQTDDGLITPKQQALALGTGIVGAGISGVSGKLANKLGFGDVDTVGTQNITRAMPARIAGGMVTEGALEEMPQSAMEQAAQNAALDKPIMQGVGDAAGMGLVTGGMMGGGMGVLHKNAPAPMVEPPPLEPAAQVPSVEPSTPVPPVQPIAPTPHEYINSYYKNIEDMYGKNSPEQQKIINDVLGEYDKNAKWLSDKNDDDLSNFEIKNEIGKRWDAQQVTPIASTPQTESTPQENQAQPPLPPYIPPPRKPNAVFENALATVHPATLQTAVVSDAPAKTPVEQSQPPTLAPAPIPRKEGAVLENAVETAAPAPVEPPAPIIPQAAPRSKAYDPEQVKRDAEQKAKLAAIANEPNRPTVRPLEDERVEPHAEVLKNMAKDVVPNGGVTIMPDGSRTPSVNPEWYQGLRDALPTANLTPKAIEIAVNKAAEGKPLFKNQEAIVTAMLDHIDMQIEDNQPSELDRAFNRLAPHIPEEHFNELVDEARNTDDIEKFTQNLNLFADHYENKQQQSSTEPEPSATTNELPNAPADETTRRDNTDIQPFDVPVADASNFDNETFADDSVTKNEQPNPVRDNENSPNPQPNDYGNPIADNDNAVDEPGGQPFNADAVTDFAPTHELPSGEKVKLETNDDGEKYFVEQDGSEWNYTDAAETITNEQINTTNNLENGGDGILQSQDNETTQTPTASLDSQTASDNQATPPVENAVESQSPETPAENIQPTQQDIAPAPQPILKADGTPVTSNIGATIAEKNKACLILTKS